MPNEPRCGSHAERLAEWVIETVNEEGEITRRYGACHEDAYAVIDLMRDVEMTRGNYNRLRRRFPDEGEFDSPQGDVRPEIYIPGRDPL